jgi:hypothetical protein
VTRRRRELIEPNLAEPIPQDKKHLHFGAGQTEARIELPPGKHTLQLVLGDAKHRLACARFASRPALARSCLCLAA